MSEVLTSWTEAMTDPYKAIIALISCLQHNKNAWIEIRKNGDQAFPIMKKNPELDNSFNWTMSYGTTRNEDEINKRGYFNDTEKDLTFNWTACFGTEKAIEEYQKNDVVSPDMFNGSICHPVRIKDANAYRRDVVGDNYDYTYFVTYWKPKKGIESWIVDESIGDVFVVCYEKDTDEKVDKKKAMVTAAQLLLAYAETIPDKED